MDTEHTSTPQMSRRVLLGTGTAVAAGLLAAPGRIRADGPHPVPLSFPPTVSTSTLPPLTAGLEYIILDGHEFHPSYYSDGRQVMNGGTHPTTPNTLAAQLPVPIGARIKELTTVAYAASGDFAVFLKPLHLISNLGDAFAWTEITNPSPNVASSTCDFVVPADVAILAATTEMTGDGNHRVRAVRVGYEAPHRFVPIAPARVFDSRYISPVGKIQPGANRVVSVKDRYAPSSEVLLETNVVPAGAKAISYNITVAGTEGAAGLLSVNPGDATALTTSTINWRGAGNLIANGSVVKVDSSRFVKVFCVGGATHFLIDVTGYYV